MKLEKEGWVALKTPLREPPLLVPLDNTQDQTNAVQEGISQEQNGEEAEEERMLLLPEISVDDSVTASV